VNGVLLGTGDLRGLILGAGSKQLPQKTTHTMVLDSGPESIDTAERIIQVINFLGQPTLQKEIIIDGKSDVAARNPGKGWVTYEKIGVTYEFIPKLQDEVLFR